MNFAAKIASITSIDELDGYEAEVRRRTLFPGEKLAIEERRRELQKERR